MFTRDINKAILISDAMETGTVQINSAPSRGPDHFPFQVHFLPSLNAENGFNHHDENSHKLKKKKNCLIHCGRVSRTAALVPKESPTALP